VRLPTRSKALPRRAEPFTVRRVVNRIFADQQRRAVYVLLENAHPSGRHIGVKAAFTGAEFDERLDVGQRALAVVLVSERAAVVDVVVVVTAQRLVDKVFDSRTFCPLTNSICLVSLFCTVTGRPISYS